MDNEGNVREEVVWTPEARERLERVPEGVMRDLTRQRVERLARSRGVSTVTEELVETKYGQWAEGSAKANSEAVWSDDARARIDHVPDFVRGMVVQAVEAYAKQQGLDEITPETLEAAKGFWGGTGRFHRS